MVILAKDFIDEDTEITSVEMIPGYNIADLGDWRLSRYVRFENQGLIEITVKLPLAKQITGIGIAGHNLSENTVIAINGGAYKPIASLSHTLIQILLDTDTVTLHIMDPSTPIIQIGRIIVGEKYKTPYIADNVQVTLLDTSAVLLSSTRQPYGYDGATGRQVSVQFPVIEQGVETDEYRDFLSYVGKYKPFILDFDIECFDERILYGIVANDKIISFQLNDAHFWTSMLTIEETY